MKERNKSSIGNAHKVLFMLLALLAFIGMVLFGCSAKIDNETNINYNGNGSSQGEGNSNNSLGSSTSSGDSSSSSPNGSGDSSSSGDSNSSGISSSSDASSSSSSHIPTVTDPGANCAYQTTWCGGITFENVKKGSMEATDVGATDKEQERPNCIYATAIVQIGNESGGISINGTTFATGSASRCGGGQWGDNTPCASKFASIAKVDGGYYIYIPAWAGQDFKTTGGQPSCPSTPAPGTSSSSNSNIISSSSTASTSGCVEPMYGIPPNGVKSCIKKDGKCYTCNPDRGKECENAWVWQANSIDTYWYKEVSCSETGGGGTTYNLTCTGLAQTGVAGTAVTQPTVKCNADNVTSISWSGAPTSWTSPTTGTYNVNATANCGGSNKTVSCGTLTVSAAPTASTLTCTGLAATGIAGTAITKPTVKCGSSTISSPTFTGEPNWSSPSTGSYDVKANAVSPCTQAADCGIIKVNSKLTCDALTTTSVIAGTAVTPPTVKCGTTSIANTGSNIIWSGAPDYWSAPTAGTYNNIKATANTGDCNGQTATCSGTLTVNNKLSCESVTQAITTGQTPTKPKVTCGSTTVTNNITWSPTSINSAINTAQTISNVKATATCSNQSQTADCAGTITVTAPQTTPSSSSGGGGGGSPSYSASSPGNETSKVTQYWDACKPSCSWSGKGGIQANSCNITGTNIGHNDGDRSACDGGSAFTCMKQAPWKVSNISFGYVAAGIGQCGDCWQFDFPNGHVMVVMKTNIGDIKEGAKFDLMIPGGGVGDFDALTRQVTNSGVNNPDMGVRYGGFRGACGWDYSTTSVNCVKQKCESVFANLPDLKAGCLWWTENLGNSGNWNNPTVKYKSVTCPTELTSKY